VNRKALYIVAILSVLVVVRYAFFGGREAPAVVEPEDSLPAAEKRLDSVRKLAATLPGEEDLYKHAAAELSGREKDLLQAGTDQQALVALLALVQNTARANQVEIRGSQEFRERPLNADYGEVSVTVAFSCGMDQLVNLLAAIGNQPEILSTNEIQITAGADKRKNVQVRLNVAAAVPRKLIPEKKGVAAF
jgi:hypothetical protein